MHKSTSRFLKSLIAIGLLAGATTANAAWIRVVDRDPLDSAFNPGGLDPSMDPTNQNPDTVAAWIEDLVGLLPGTLNLIDQGDDTPSSLSVSLLATYISVHYGNYGGDDDPLDRATIAYNCANDCGTFTPETMQGISDYRVYSGGRPDQPVPTPALLPLLGLGLISLGLMRRKA
ncbi:MAG: hypothetical protein ACO3Z6_15395 [Pseudomonadales bacterium]